MRCDPGMEAGCYEMPICELGAKDVKSTTEFSRSRFMVEMEDVQHHSLYDLIITHSYCKVTHCIEFCDIRS